MTERAEPVYVRCYFTPTGGDRHKVGPVNSITMTREQDRVDNPEDPREDGTLRGESVLFTLELRRTTPAPTDAEGVLEIELRGALKRPAQRFAVSGRFGRPYVPPGPGFHAFHLAPFSAAAPAVALA